MAASTGYDSACCVCKHQWRAGLTGTQCCFDGYRQLLPLGSAGRRERIQSGGHTYEFEAPETKPTPGQRTNDSARKCLAVVETIGLDSVGGHKHAPLVALFAGFDWYRYNPPELMHDTKIFVEMLLKTLVGKVSNAGFYESWSHDAAHRRENKIRGIFRATWPENGGPLPWRLTREQRLLLDARAGTLIWPQQTEKLFYNGASFWTKPNRMWKTRRKITLLYFILPMQLRDQVPAVTHALQVFVWAMRQLLGQVHSFERAHQLKILPGSRTVDKTRVPQLEGEVKKGLVLSSGSLPIGNLNPGMHHFGHVGKYVGTHALLHKLWMMGFERFVLPLHQLNVVTRLTRIPSWYASQLC